MPPVSSWDHRYLITRGFVIELYDFAIIEKKC